MIGALGGPGFPELYLKAIRSIADLDSAVIMGYGMGSRPEILHDELAGRYRTVFYDRYMKGAFLLSPLYRVFRSGRQGFFHVAEVAPDGFFESRYYHEYYGHSGLVDQVFYLKRFENGIAIVASLGRTRKLSPYDRRSIETFGRIEPVVLALMARNWEHLDAARPSFSDYLHRAFETFGTSRLSKREKEVVNRILQGASSKSVARDMRISPETERSYRKSIYRKLDVNSHSELYYLFFRSLDFADRAEGRDPLEMLRRAADSGGPRPARRRDSGG